MHTALLVNELPEPAKIGILSKLFQLNRGCHHISCYIMGTIGSDSDFFLLSLHKAD